MRVASLWTRVASHLNATSDATLIDALRSTGNAGRINTGAGRVERIQKQVRIGNRSVMKERSAKNVINGDFYAKESSFCIIESYSHLWRDLDLAANPREELRREATRVLHGSSLYFGFCHE